MQTFVLYFEAPTVRELFDHGPYVRNRRLYRPILAKSAERADRFVELLLPRFSVVLDGVTHKAKPIRLMLREEHLVKQY